MVTAKCGTLPARSCTTSMSRIRRGRTPVHRSRGPALPHRRDEQPRPFLRQHGESSGITSLLVLKEPGEEQVLVTACQDNALKLWRMPGFSRRGILAARAPASDIVRVPGKGTRRVLLLWQHGPKYYRVVRTPGLRAQACLI